MTQVRTIGTLAVLALTFAAGWTANGWRLGNDILAMERDASDARGEALEARQQRKMAEDARMDVLIERAHQVLRQDEQVERVITREVVRYVEREKSSGTACRFGIDWVRLHDAAALGLPPDAAALARVDGAAGDVTAADGLPTVTDNYAAARRNARRLESLQRYVRTVCLAP